MNQINYSITMNGVSSCSAGCVYCSAATTLDYTQGIKKGLKDKADIVKELEAIDEKIYDTEYRADYTKLAETIERNSRFEAAVEKQKKGEQCDVHIDIWGGDPITNHLATQDIVDFLEDFFIKKHGMKLTVSSSTNGLPLIRDEICDYYRNHKMTMQISHDGCGQWMRTGEIDPLYTPGFAENCRELFRDGTLNMVNDCLNFYNGSVFANKRYWDDYFRSIDMPIDKWNRLYLKLNRCYDGVYDLQQKNVKGIFGSDKREWKELINKPFGDIRHHNATDLNSGNIELDHLFAHELDDYLNEWLQLAIMLNDPVIQSNVMWKPYKGYLTEQLNRWQWMKSRDDSMGSCRRYQMTVHGVGDPKYWQKPNRHGEVEMFVIDTTGRYCECNLIDADHTVKNIGCATVPKQCSSCKYYLQSECMGCGTEIFTEDCEWRYRWVQLLEQAKNIQHLLGNVRKAERETISKEVLNGRLTNSPSSKR